VTDENKNIVATITYHPFGEVDVKEGSEDYLFTGKEKDSTGLHYFGARYYDPELGRFLTRDPVGGRTTVPQALNPYSYCLNNPLKYIDPDGRDPVNCDKYKKEKEKVLQYSHVPQKLDYVYLPEDAEWFIYFIIIMCGGGLAIMAIALAPAFLVWLAPVAKAFILTYGLRIAVQVITFILGLIVSGKLSERNIERMMGEMTPEECMDFFAFLDNYCREWSVDVDRIIFNDDGTFTVVFSDGSKQRFKCVDGQWIPVPEESNDSENTSDDSEGPSEGPGDSSIPPGNLPPGTCMS